MVLRLSLSQKGERKTGVDEVKLKDGKKAYREEEREGKGRITLGPLFLFFHKGYNLSSKIEYR